MEINITQFYNNENTHDFSGSIATHGENAARDTWNAAKNGPMLLDTPEKLSAMQAWADSSGGDFGVMDDVELNALFIQLISGDINEMQGLCGDDWAEYEALSQEGTVGGRLFIGDDGNVYYYLGE